jgi:hypothetical protein
LFIKQIVSNKFTLKKIIIFCFFYFDSSDLRLFLFVWGFASKWIDYVNCNFFIKHQKSIYLFLRLYCYSIQNSCFLSKNFCFLVFLFFVFSLLEGKPKYDDKHQCFGKPNIKIPNLVHFNMLYLSKLNGRKWVCCFSSNNFCFLVLQIFSPFERKPKYNDWYEVFANSTS